MEKKPLKRSRELRPFSIDHHQGLLLCWKIRTGLKKEVGIERISVYVNWFYTNYLLPHFELEEQYLFPVLDSSSNLIKRALEEHRIIRMLIKEAVSEVMLENLQEYWKPTYVLKSVYCLNKYRRRRVLPKLLQLKMYTGRENLKRITTMNSGNKKNPD